MKENKKKTKMNKNKFQPGQFRDKGWLYIPFNPKPMKNEHKMQYKSKLTYCYTHLPINDTPYSHESRLHASYKQRERTSAAKCFMATSRGSRGEKKRAIQSLAMENIRREFIAKQKTF